jgi:hypothetical protein
LAFLHARSEQGGEDASGGLSEGMGTVAALGLGFDFVLLPLFMDIFL